MVGGIVWLPFALAAELSESEVRMAQAINSAVLKAGQSYASGDFQASGEHISEAIEKLKAATEQGSPELYDQLLPAMKRKKRKYHRLP